MAIACRPERLGVGHERCVRAEGYCLTKMYPSHGVSGSICRQRPATELTFQVVRSMPPPVQPRDGLSLALLKLRLIRLPLGYPVKLGPEPPLLLRNSHVPDT